MKTYYIFRHGETFVTAGNKWGYGLRVLSAPILESGKPALRRMGEFFKDIPSDLNVQSPLKRCQQTAAIVTDITGKKFVTDRRINEFLIETFGHFRHRIKSFVDQIEDSDHQTILICTHGAVIAGLVSYLTKGNFPASDLSDYPPPGIVIKIEGKKIEEFDFNN